VDWDEFQAQSANNRTISVRLSPDSLTLLLSGVDGFIPRGQWRYGDETPVDDTDWDTIDAMIAKAATELMTNIFTGTIFPLATATIPAGALECDGSTHLRVDYPALYAVLDSAFIVDADHFTTPDLRGRTILGVGTGSGLSTYAEGAMGGQESHALTTAELAAHNHSVTDLGHSHTLTDPGHSHTKTDPGHNHSVTDPGHTHTYNRANLDGALISGGSVTAHTITAGVNSGSKVTGVTVDNNTTGISYASATTGITEASATTGISTGNNGSGTAHENRQPYLALRYAIWA